MMAWFFGGVVVGAALARFLPDVPDERLPGDYGPLHDYRERDAEHRSVERHLEWRNGKARAS